MTWQRRHIIVIIVVTTSLLALVAWPRASRDAGTKEMKLPSARHTLSLAHSRARYVDGRLAMFRRVQEKEE
jgi:hypothetical protein